MESNTMRKRSADRILYEMGLWERLCQIGKPHIIGSYVLLGDVHPHVKSGAVKAPDGHAITDGELWNLDLWFFDQETIHKAERYCDNIMEMVRQTPGSRECIIRMKQELQKRGLYEFCQYTSIDVYRAVLEQGITDTDELLARYIKSENM